MNWNEYKQNLYFGGNLTGGATVRYLSDAKISAVRVVFASSQVLASKQTEK